MAQERPKVLKLDTRLRNFRFQWETERVLALLAQTLRMSQRAVVEQAIHEKAKKEGIQ